MMVIFKSEDAIALVFCPGQSERAVRDGSEGKQVKILRAVKSPFCLYWVSLWFDKQVDYVCDKSSNWSVVQYIYIYSRPLKDERFNSKQSLFNRIGLPN